MILTRGKRLVRVHAKARIPENIRSDPLVVMRHALADRWYIKYRREMLKQLNAQTIEASNRVAAGNNEPVTDSMEVRWFERLIQAKRPMVTAMVRSGTELTDAVEFGKKSMDFFPGLLGPDVNPFAGKADPVGLEVVGYDSDDIFLHQAQTQNVEAYLQATSKVETETSRKKLDKLYKDANSYWDETLQRGLTPREVAKQMTQQGLADSATRATMMSRTTTMWAYNEGAQQSYINAGIPVQSWVTSDDDVLCEFCVQMDGQMIRTGDPFLPAGTELVGLEGGTLDIPNEWSISHPPLHPMCFPGNVKVITDTGQIPIERIQIGDMVRTLSGYHKIDQKHERNYSGKLVSVIVEIGMDFGWKTFSQVPCTPDHPFIVKGKEDSLIKEAKELQPGDLVFLPGNFGRIDKVEEGPEESIKVYNLAVDKEPMFFANGILVHNCRCTTVPIVVEADVAVIRKAADALREDYTKKIADGTMDEARARRASLLRRRRKKKPKPLRKKVPKKEPTPFAETKETRKALEKKKPKVPKPVPKPKPVVPEEPVWGPAATKKEATQWAENNIVNPKSARIDTGNPVTGYNKLRMESANVINEELTTLVRQYGIRLDGIDARALGHAEADVFAGMTRGRILDVNTKYWNRLDAFGKHVTRLHADGWHASRTVNDILVHEYGHGIIGNSPQKLKLIGDAFKVHKANLVTSVSRYSATKPVEMWAEIFVKFHRGRTLPKWADDLARKVLKKPARKVRVKKPPKKVVREAARAPKVTEQPIELSKAQKNTLDSIDKLREEQWKFKEGIRGYFPTEKDLKQVVEKLEKKINKLEDQVLKTSKKQLKSTNREQAIKELGERSEGLPTFEWMSTLTDAETKGLGEWMTDGGVEKIRRVYNPTVKSSERLVKVARRIEEALARGEAYKGTTYRGIGDLNKSVYENLKTTKELKWDALTSATKDLDVAKGFVGWGDQVVFVIKGNKSGVRVSPLWRQIHKIKDFDEVLIKPGARYRVVKVTEKKIMQPDYFRTHFGREPKRVNRLTVQLKEL